jgi:hypothetical protein
MRIDVLAELDHLVQLVRSRVTLAIEDLAQISSESVDEDVDMRRWPVVT